MAVLNSMALNSMAGKRHSTPAKQRGVVLVVSLIILTILTIIAVNTATDLGLQANMARNSQLGQNVFNVAYSEINAQFENVSGNQDLLAQAIDNNPAPLPLTLAQMEMDDTAPAGYTPTFKIDYQEGSTYLPDGYTADSYTGHLFNFDSGVSVDNTGTASDQTQGVSYAGPKEP